MKRTYFHGTSFDNLKSILKNGLEPDFANKVWSVSGHGVYLWSPDELVKCGETDEEYKNDRAKQFAYESAQMTIGLSKSGKCVVFEIELEESELENDESCENMSGAMVCNRTVSVSEIKSVWISPDLSLLKGYFISIAMRRDLFAQAFTDLQRKIGEVFANAEFYPDCLDDFPLRKMKI